MLAEAKRFMQEGNHDGLMAWACDHDNGNSGRETLKSVANAYEYLIGKGYGLAANNLGSMYYCGRYFREDVDQAISYYNIACDMGTGMAFGNLGCCYFYGRRKDYRKAYEVFAEGALLFNNIECLYMLGEMYQYGYHVKRHPDKARYLYKKALDNIDPDDPADYNCIGEVHYRLGRFLIEEGTNIKAGLKHLHIAQGFLYEKIDDDKFAADNISKIKALIADAERMILTEKCRFYA